MGGMEDTKKTRCVFELSNGDINFGYIIADDVKEYDMSPHGIRVLAKRIGPERFAIPDIMKIERGVDNIKLSFRIMGNGTAVYQVGGVDVQEAHFDRACRLLALKGVQL